MGVDSWAGGCTGAWRAGLPTEAVIAGVLATGSLAGGAFCGGDFLAGGAFAGAGFLAAGFAGARFVDEAGVDFFDGTGFFDAEADFGADFL